MYSMQGMKPSIRQGIGRGIFLGGVNYAHNDTALGGSRESRNIYAAMIRILFQVSSSPTSPELFVINVRTFSIK